MQFFYNFFFCCNLRFFSKFEGSGKGVFSKMSKCVFFAIFLFIKCKIIKPNVSIFIKNEVPRGRDFSFLVKKSIKFKNGENQKYTFLKKCRFGNFHKKKGVLKIIFEKREILSVIFDDFHENRGIKCMFMHIKGIVFIVLKAYLCLITSPATMSTCGSAEYFMG